MYFVFSSQSATHGGQQINEFTGFALCHKGKAKAPDNVYNPADGADAYTNPSIYPKLAQYTEAARKRHGDEFDPTTEPLDIDLLMRLGPGKQHGRYWMANSAIESSSVPRLSEIRARSTSSSSDIPIAPRQPSSTQMMAAFQVCTVLFIVHWFYTCALPCGCNIAGPACRVAGPAGGPGGGPSTAARGCPAGGGTSDAGHGGLLPGPSDPGFGPASVAYLAARSSPVF